MDSDPIPSRDEYIAASLEIPLEIVSRHPYSLDLNSGNDRVGYQWRVLWQGDPPTGVETHQTGDEVWSYVVPFDWEDADV